jgi:hypothetical protein
MKDFTPFKAEFHNGSSLASNGNYTSKQLSSEFKEHNGRIELGAFLTSRSAKTHSAAVLVVVVLV